MADHFAQPSNSEQVCPYCGALMGDETKHVEWHLGTAVNTHQVREIIKAFPDFRPPSLGNTLSELTW